MRNSTRTVYPGSLDTKAQLRQGVSSQHAEDQRAEQHAAGEDPELTSVLPRLSAALIPL